MGPDQESATDPGVKSVVCHQSPLSEPRPEKQQDEIRAQRESRDAHHSGSRASVGVIEAKPQSEISSSETVQHRI